MTRLDLDFHPKVGDEIVEAINWYRKRSQTAAEAFITALSEALDQIATEPDRAAPYMSGRRAVERFPYIVIYKRHGHRVRVSAVAHTSCRPGYWKNRRFSS